MVRREGRGAAFRNRERERPRGRLELLGSDLGLGVNGAKQRDFFDFFRVDKSLPFTEAERDLGSWAKAPVGQNVSWRGARIQRGLLRPGGPAPKGLKDSAQGFNPGNPRNKRFALKGREMRLPDESRTHCRAKVSNGDGLPLGHWACFRLVRTFRLAPIQGESFLVVGPRVKTLG